MTYAQSDEYDNLAWLDLGLNVNNVGSGVHAGITTNYNLHLYSNTKFLTLLNRNYLLSVVYSYDALCVG